MLSTKWTFSIVSNDDTHTYAHIHTQIYPTESGDFHLNSTANFNAVWWKRQSITYKNPRLWHHRFKGKRSPASGYSKHTVDGCEILHHLGWWKGVDSSMQLKINHDLNRYRQIHFNLSLPGVNSRFNPFCCWMILGGLNSDLILC